MSAQEKSEKQKRMTRTARATQPVCWIRLLSSPAYKQTASSERMALSPWKNYLAHLQIARYKTSRRKITVAHALSRVNASPVLIAALLATLPTHRITIHQLCIAPLQRRARCFRHQSSRRGPPSSLRLSLIPTLGRLSVLRILPER